MTKKTMLDTQVGGDHYKKQAIQPIEYIEANNLGSHEANVVKYVSRWKDKNGVEDLKKAKWYLERLIEINTSTKEEDDDSFPILFVTSVSKSVNLVAIDVSYSDDEIDDALASLLTNGIINSVFGGMIVNPVEAIVIDDCNALVLEVVTL